MSLSCLSAKRLSGGLLAIVRRIYELGSIDMLARMTWSCPWFSLPLPTAEQLIRSFRVPDSCCVAVRRLYWSHLANNGYDSTIWKIRVSLNVLLLDRDRSKVH